MSSVKNKKEIAWNESCVCYKQWVGVTSISWEELPRIRNKEWNAHSTDKRFSQFHPFLYERVENGSKRNGDENKAGGICQVLGCVSGDTITQSRSREENDRGERALRQITPRQTHPYQSAMLLLQNQCVRLFIDLHLVESQVQTVLKIAIAEVIVHISNDAVDSVVHRAHRRAFSRPSIHFSPHSYRV